jgi:hypothetical protein
MEDTAEPVTELAVAGGAHTAGWSPPPVACENAQLSARTRNPMTARLLDAVGHAK